MGKTQGNGTVTKETATVKGDGMVSERQQDMRRISTQVGASFLIHLVEDRTRGEQWVPEYNPEQLVLLDDEYLRIASNNAVDWGRRTFEFQAVAPGEHHLVFDKRMGWKFTSEDRRVFLIDAGAKD